MQFNRKYIMVSSHLKLFTLVGCLFIFLIISCEKWDFDRTSFTQVITVGALEVDFSSAFLLGDIEGLRNVGITATGFVLSATVADDENLRLEQSNIDVVASPKQIDSTINEDRAFAARATDLAASTKYFFRAYVELEGDERAYGSIDTFTTSSIIISTPAIDSTFEGCGDEMTITVIIEGARSSPGTSFGVVWSSDESNIYPSFESGNRLETTVLGPTGNIQVQLLVNCNTSYFLRGFYKTQVAETYGPLYGFTTVVGGVWLQSRAFPGDPRQGAVAFSVKEKGYIGYGQNVGEDSCHNVMNDFWEFDPEREQWDPIPNTPASPSARAWALGFSAAGKGYLGLGCDEGEICLSEEFLTRKHDFHQFDAATKQWTTASDFPSSFFRSVPYPEEAAGGEGGHTPYLRAYSYTIGEITYVGGGWTCSWLNLNENGSVRFTYFICFDAQKSLWDLPEIGDFHLKYEPRPVSFTIGNKGYFGLINNRETVYRDKFFVFDFEEEFPEWTELKESFPGATRRLAAAFAVGDKGYVGLGFSLEGNQDLLDFYEFNPQTVDWRKVNDFRGDARSEAVSFVIGNMAYVGLGIDANRNGLTDLWLYVPELHL